MKKILLLFALLAIATSAMSQIKVLPNGKVGVGTTNPNEQMQIGSLWTFHDGGTKYIGLNATHTSSGSVRIATGYSSMIRFSEGGDISLVTAGTGNAGSQVVYTGKNITLTAAGNVGIGTIATPKGKLHIVTNNADFVFHPSNKSDGKSYFGTNNVGDNGVPYINFYHPSVGYNNVRMNAWVLSSDSTLKTDIRSIENATSILKQIKTYSYFFKSDSLAFRDTIDLRKRDYGVLAQEMMEILPELVDTCMETMFLNYNAFIGILIAGFNEQQAVIDTLKNEIEILQRVVVLQDLQLIELTGLYQRIEDLEEGLVKCCDGSQGAPVYAPPAPPQNPQTPNEQPVLFQNAPNPFSTNTEISCFLPETTTSAILYIYNTGH